MTEVLITVDQAYTSMRSGQANSTVLCPVASLRQKKDQIITGKQKLKILFFSERGADENLHTSQLLSLQVVSKRQIRRAVFEGL